MEKIQKYHEQGNTTSMTAALTKLRGLPITFEILRNTKVGKQINQLRQKVDDKEVKQQMRNLIKYWKTIAQTNDSAAPPNGTTATPTTEQTTLQPSPSNNPPPTMPEAIQPGVDTTLVQRTGDP